MYEDGLYISHGPENHVLAVVREDNGQTLWIRNFATAESALDIMEDNILAELDRSEVEQELNRSKGYFSAELQRPEDGYKEVAFQRYTRQSVG